MASQRRPGDWMCPNCDFLIFASKKSCRKCGATNPSGGSKSHKTGKRGGSGRRGKKGGKFSRSGSEEWICSNCSSSNYPDRDKCRKCRTHRSESPDTTMADADTSTTTSTSSHKGQKRRNPRQDEWVCTRCNTENYADREKCRKCDVPKSKHESPADDNDIEMKTTDSNVVSVQLNVEIELQLKKLKEGNPVDIDLVFVMDCTGSMSDKINAGKQTIKNIMTELKKDKANHINTIHFGYIAYRDQPKSEKTFITKVFPLTQDVNKMYEYIDTYGAAGGGDGPEALTEAIHDSLTKIQYNDNHMKINILICDAPGHGWGCTSYDTYPDGNPNGYDPIQLCYDLSKKGIVLYVLGCEPSISYYKEARDILEGLCSITEGYYLPLSNADLLPSMILKSLKQEINLKFIEKFVIDMMIKIRAESDDTIEDEETLLNAVDLNLIRGLRMENKMEVGTVYNGAYDYFNINLIKNTARDEGKQNMQYVLKNIKRGLAQPKVIKFSTKSKFAMKSGDWNCTKCHYHNFANRWFCRMCNNVNHTLKNGDWLCTKCDDINFAKNKVCRKCKVTATE
eukprot:555149_1